MHLLIHPSFFSSYVPTSLPILLDPSQHTFTFSSIHPSLFFRSIILPYFVSSFATSIYPSFLFPSFPIFSSLLFTSNSLSLNCLAFFVIFRRYDIQYFPSTRLRVIHILLSHPHIFPKFSKNHKSSYLNNVSYHSVMHNQRYRCSNIRQQYYNSCVDTHHFVSYTHPGLKNQKK